MILNTCFARVKVLRAAAMSHASQKTFSSDSSTDLSSVEKFEIVCPHVWGTSWLDNVRTADMDTRPIDKSEGKGEDVNVVQCRPHDQSNQKHKQESDNERKQPFSTTSSVVPFGH